LKSDKMLLKNLKLNNIRSYVSEEINFPESSILLSGDVGSGKSTILLSIDFALFGIERGILDSSALLRHGADSGSVELNFEISGKDVTIKRNLKRDRDSIKQDSGFLTIDGVRYQLMPSELKSRILSLLGYPTELLTKSKSLLFRYTVYTPQEQMKEIMMMEEEDRKAILIKLFGIDKYKRIAENADMLAKELRTTKRIIEKSISDLDEKRSKKNEEEKKIYVLKKEDELVKIRLEEINSRINETKKCREELDRKSREQNELKQKLSANNASLRRFREELKTIDNEVEELDVRKKKLFSLIIELELPKNDRKYIEKRIEEFEKERDDFSKKIVRLSDDIKRLSRIYDEGICETCGQTVHNPESFKENIERKKESETEFLEKLKIINSEIKDLKSELDKIIDYELKRERNKSIEKQLAIIEENENKLQKRRKEIIKEVEELEKEIEFMNKKIDVELDLKIADIDKKLTELLREEREIARELSRIDQQIDDCTKTIESLIIEITKKEIEKEKIEKIIRIENWISHFFINLMGIIERHAMLKIQQDFNTYFQNWFNIIIDDENINVSIDNNFTAVIMQNGYMTEYQNLSGGEKTSVALSYRLALNKVINTLVETIKTKDLIILDEPTDGFSTDQLEKIRDVLDELNLRQMIIVSHEPKIDTFVDNVIKVYKEGHISRIVS